MPVKTGAAALTEKEKETLRLIVRGHDAKSVARSLDLSVHTINERLRDARRKLAVSSSREAARILFDAEGGDPVHRPPETGGDKEMGEDAAPPVADPGTAPIGGARRPYRPRIIFGVLVMTLALGLLLLATSRQDAPAPPTPPAASVAAPDPAVVDSARRWLALLDQARWDDSYRLTGAAFRTLNTAKVWASASETARRPLGAMLSRTFASQQYLPAPPHGYEVAKFQTRFANRANAVETVTLDREDGEWRVVGVTIE